MSNMQKEIKELKDQLKVHQEEIDRLKRERNEYLRVSAHQMKSPLTTISFSIDTLLKEYAGRLNWKQLRIIESIKHSTDNLQNLIHDILDLERLRAEKIVLEDVDFLEICEQTIRDLHSKIDDKGIRFEVNFPHKGLITHGNRIALKQAILNLLDNAIKYSQKNGEVHFTIGYDEREGTIAGVIKDEGIGIPEEEKKYLFDEFYRSPNARIFDKTGTGFGLAIVKRVLDVSGGNIEISSKENEGTKVTFTLPLVKRSERTVAIREKRVRKRKIVVVGGVAAGPKAASRARRLDHDAEITLFEREHSLAYAGCALPYYISGLIKGRKDLSFAISGTQDVSDFFRNVKGIDIRNLSEVIEIDRKNKFIQYKDLVTDRTYTEPYDVLVLATGSVPLIPNIEGANLQNVLTLHGINDAERIKFAIVNDIARDIVIVGGGLIGTEIADALTVSGARVTIVEQKEQILSFLDPEMAALVEQHMVHKGIRIIKNEEVRSFKGRERVESVQLSKVRIPADLVILAMGVKPNVELAKKAGLEIGETGAIAVNEYLQTSDPSIYAVGDCTETWHALLERPYYLPLGSIANRHGRIAGANATGKENHKFGPIAGTIIFKIFDYHVAKTGLNEKEAGEIGYDPVSCYVPEYDKEHFIPGSEIINIKMTACRKMKRLLGVQIIGKGDVAKRIDLAAMTITKKGTIEDILSVDLGYAPAYSNAMGAIVVCANVLQNKIDGLFEGISAYKVQKLLNTEGDRFTFIDLRSAFAYEDERIEGIISIPIETLKSRIDEIPRNKGIVLVCETGSKSYQAALILKAHGFKNVKILEGGLRMWPFKISRA